MNDPAPDTTSFENLCFALNDMARWLILRELSKGEPLPAIELARRVGRSANSISKHLQVLRDAGVAEQTYARCYRLAPQVRFSPETQQLDLGRCILRLDRF